jgi:Protein of unknown function (DUF1573)
MSKGESTTMGDRLRLMVFSFLTAALVCIGCSHPTNATRIDPSEEPAIPQSRPLAGLDQQIDLFHDFGVVPGTTTATHVFEITNSSQFQWTIKQVRASCRCTTAGVTSNTIPAGGKTSVKVKYHAPKDSTDDERRVDIRLSGDEAPRVVLRIKASVRAPMTILPKALDLRVRGNLLPASLGSFEVHNFWLADWSALELGDLPLWLTATTTRLQHIDTSADSTAPRQAWRVQINAGSREAFKKLSCGVYSVLLRALPKATAIETGDLASTIMLRIHKDPLVEVRPAELFFGAVPLATTATKDVTITLASQQAPQRAQVPVVSQAPRGHFTCDLVSHLGSEWHYRVSFRPANKDGVVRSTLTIAFGGSDELVARVPCWGSVVRDSQGR